LVQNNTQQLPFSSLLYARVITTATTIMSKAVPASHLEIDMLLVAWNTCFLQLYSAWFPLKDSLWCCYRKVSHLWVSFFSSVSVSFQWRLRSLKAYVLFCCQGNQEFISCVFIYLLFLIHWQIRGKSGAGSVFSSLFAVQWWLDLALLLSSSRTSDEQFHHFHFQCLISCLRPSGAMNGYKFPCGGSCVERKVLYVCTRSKNMTWQGIEGNCFCSFLPGDLLGLLDIAHTSSPGGFPSAFWNSRPLQGQYICLRSPSNKSTCKGLSLSIEACWTIHNWQVWLYGLCTIWRFKKGSMHNLNCIKNDTHIIALCGSIMNVSCWNFS
jgi:hypothetical protein